MLLKPWRMSCNLRLHTNLTNLNNRLVAETGASNSSAYIAKVGVLLGSRRAAPPAARSVPPRLEEVSRLTGLPGRLRRGGRFFGAALCLSADGPRRRTFFGPVFSS